MAGRTGGENCAERAASARRRPAAMFRTPRKTCHSDARSSYEVVHEKIVERLRDPSELSMYMFDVMPVFEKIDALSQVEARREYFAAASKWMTPGEHKKFEEDDAARPASVDEHPDYCANCKRVQRMIISESEATITCEACSATVSYTGHRSDRYLPWDYTPPSRPCPYKRSNHFNEYLDSFMARQSGSMPADIFNQIRAEMKKQRITDASALTQKRLKTILKDLNLNKYYENAPFLLYQLKGEKPPALTRAIEQELKSNFDLIQGPFERVVKVVAPQRKNFLSYSYTIYKMLQLMELDHLLEYFSLLKSREKLAIQDKIWKGICEELNWRYIPSV